MPSLLSGGSPLPVSDPETVRDRDRDRDRVDSLAAAGNRSLPPPLPLVAGPGQRWGSMEPPMSLLDEARKLGLYVLGKKSELEDMDLRDVVMAKAILDIHRERIGKERVIVPLFSLRRIHRLDRENAIEATGRRIESLRDHHHALVTAGVLTCETLADVLPSVSWIKGVRKSPDEVLAFEGNGRIAAMQAVFCPEDAMRVEIEEYVFRNPAAIIRRLDRVRRMNSLLDDPVPADWRS